MWLVADSGSTKTTWVLFNSDGVIEEITSSGLNPLFLSESEFKEKLIETIPADWVVVVEKLWFYGAGCGTVDEQLKTTQWLKSTFIKAAIEVDSDLLAAARATCGVKAGIVAILGTGSNSCFYDGKIIVDHIKPLGFILGDEGSGAALGKSLVRKLLRNQLSPQLTTAIHQDLGMSYEELIQKIYRSEWPNRFLASCSKALHTYKGDPEIAGLITSEFDQFTELLETYNSIGNVNFIGSIAFYFKPFLESSLAKRGLKLGVVIKTPADGLVNYHLTNN